MTHSPTPLTIGILGGMGPAATVDLFDRIVAATPARSDQEHIPILIVNNPLVPDRTGHLLHGGPDPVPLMADGLAKLARMGADFAVIPCNTAHHFLPQLRSQSAIPILDMISETAAAIRRAHPDAARVGILATSGTLAVGLYQNALIRLGLEPVEPTPHEIAQMMEGIYGPRGVKSAGVTAEARAALAGVGRALMARGAQILILGCTEIPLALHDGDLPVPLVASNQILAEAAIGRAMGQGE
jgi:aspartate racemase